MVRIRKGSRPNQHEEFRRRLERGLSLSPSDSNSAQSSLPSADGDTTDIESLEEENHFPSLHCETNLVGSISQDAIEDWIQREEIGEERNIQGQPETSDSRIIIAFQCIAESIQGSLSTLTDKIETICSDLEDVVDRLVAVEAAMETMAPKFQDSTSEGSATEWTGRRQSTFRLGCDRFLLPK
ncbi:hypothetical protein N7520_009643 [Penicillium odoratum]|uniref:uncharacterized protein n=1 Tax=Penicillium odoratum TaxID=1167516 RepID=UPI0025478F38|nr:uncharacterized protein N7520_009643 [Penicillium odoratum]KAJ5752726.1 hypothetical protein N7520_009643 [Penicillium odoratum]